MTHSYSKDFIQTHPYFGDSPKETREICRANNKKSKNKFLNRGNVNNVKDPELKRICTQGDLINQAVKKTINKLSKKCKNNNANDRYFFTRFDTTYLCDFFIEIVYIFSF